jgi:serine/threonine protein kinase
VKLSPEIWRQVGPLFSEALEQGPATREAWLARAEAGQPEAVSFVRRMLAAHERAERSGDLETVPKLAPPPPWAGARASGERVGPFELLRPLGRGGMGEVWLARQADGRIEREVALKLPMAREDAGAWRERFRRERDILARLEHPNIARLYDAGVTDAGQPWLAMEYVEGLPLAEHVAARPTPVAARLAIFRQVLAAVAHAHRHLVVHRDIKPANILIDGSGQVKLLDFGIAKLVEGADAATDAGDLTRLGGRVMTIRYAAPEQVAGGAITTATDIYSLGVVLHELVTGLSPYRAAREGRALTEAMLLQEETSVPSRLGLTAAVARQCGLESPRQLARLVSGDLDAIVLKAMRRDPAERYASVELLDEDIARHLARRPVKARAGTWRYLAGRFVARHRLPLAMAAAVLVTMTAGLVLAERERRVAVAERERAQKHFASVRSLANTFIFDVHAEIESLPGSLKAREMLIRTSLEYLDALQGEAGGDPGLMLELATAYRNIGNIQGQPGGANQGNPTLALASFEKAKRLHEAIDAARPADIAALREHTSLSYVLARAYVLRADPRWQDEITRTVALARRTAALPGATPRDRARVAGAMAEQASLTGLMVGQGPQVEALVAQAVDLLEALAKEEPGNAAVLQNLASTHQRAGNLLTGNRHTPASVRAGAEHYRKGAELLRSQLAGRPGDERLGKLLLENLVGRANALALAGEPREADRVMAEALAMSADFIASDPANVEAATDRITTLAQAAFVANRAGDPARAIRHAREALAVAARLPADVLRIRDVRSNVAEAKAFLAYGLLAAAQAPRAGRGKRLAGLREARGLLRESLAFVDEARAEKLGAVPEDEVRQMQEALRRCEEGIARLG